MNERAGSARGRALSRSWTALLLLALLLAISFCAAFAFPYFWDARLLEHFGHGRRFSLFGHIAPAAVALIVGPIQLWMGWTGRNVRIHRCLGFLYLVCIALASVTAVHLVITTRRGVVFAFGLAALTIAWLVTTSLAYNAVRRRQFRQHWEWMIRSYVLTFVFVIFRLLVMLLKALKIGTSAERLNIAIWLSWAGPLLLTEAIMQGRKIFARDTAAESIRSERRSPMRRREAAAPKLAEFEPANSAAASDLASEDPSRSIASRV